MVVARRTTTESSRFDSSHHEVQALQRKLAALEQTLVAHDQALLDLHRWLAAQWNNATHDTENLAEQREGKLLRLLPDFYEYILQRDSEMKAALDSFGASLSRLQHDLSGDQASTPSARVDHHSYAALVQRIRQVAANAIGQGSTVAVISKGDNELLKLEGRQGWHFPQTENGAYAGYYPANSAEAIRHLEALRARGTAYLLVPATAFWWLEHYHEFGQHLHTHYRRVVHQEDTCAIFELRQPTTQPPVEAMVDRLRYRNLSRQIQEIAHSVLPSDATILVVSRGDDVLLSQIGPAAQHFPQTETGDYAGYYPADSASAIVHLEMLRFKGADYLLFPATAFWWLDHYQEFAAYLEQHYRVVVRQNYCCLIFSLEPKAPAIAVQPLARR